MQGTYTTRKSMNGLLKKSLTHRRSYRIKHCRGAVFVELALVFPILLIMILGVVDLGRALDHYLKINRAAYEGVREASRVPGLTDNCIGQSCPALFQKEDNPESLSQLNQSISRVIVLLIAQGVNWSGAEHTLNVEKIGNGTDAYNEITYVVSVPFRAILPFFPYGNITTRISSSDLAMPPV